MTPPLFPSGLVGITVGIDAAFGGRMSVIGDLLERHLAGDWGDIGPEDRALNDRALATGRALLSAYAVDGGHRVWIFTDAGRGSTVVLLPREW